MKLSTENKLMSSFHHSITKEERRMATYSYLDSHFSKILLFLFNQKKKTNNGNVLRTYGQLFVKENN